VAVTIQVSSSCDSLLYCGQIPQIVRDPTIVSITGGQQLQEPARAKPAVDTLPETKNN
jgi:hypothetical protein